MNKRLRPNDPKICAHCGGDFYRNPKVSYKVWDKQKHCSKICSNKAGASFGGREKKSDSGGYYWNSELDKFGGLA